jgi:hypothetical protein
MRCPATASSPFPSRSLKQHTGEPRGGLRTCGTPRSLAPDSNATGRVGASSSPREPISPPRADEARLPNDWLVVAGHPSFLWIVGFRTTASVADQLDGPFAWVFSGNRPDRTRNGEQNAPLRKRGAAAADSVNLSGVRFGGSATIRLKWSSDSSPHCWRDDPRVHELAWSCAAACIPDGPPATRRAWPFRFQGADSSGSLRQAAATSGCIVPRRSIPAIRSPTRFDSGGYAKCRRRRKPPRVADGLPERGVILNNRGRDSRQEPRPAQAHAHLRPTVVRNLDSETIFRTTVMLHLPAVRANRRDARFGRGRCCKDRPASLGRSSTTPGFSVFAGPLGPL